MEHLPAPVSFYRQFRRRRTPIAGPISCSIRAHRHPARRAVQRHRSHPAHLLADGDAWIYTLSQAAEDRITDALPVLAISIPEGPYLWNALREVLLGPHAAHALRTMHALGVLEMLIPEFHGIDALVIRDSYHRYTVDEHTFLTIDNVHGLRQPGHDYEQRLAQLLPEIDRMDLFLLALLLHDTGKARRTGEHATQSVELADSFWPAWTSMPRKGDDSEADPAASGDVVGHASRHLRSGQRAAFAEKIGSPQLLKMLTLMTLPTSRR
jgi:[protein-PII] uridylyltransferase